MTTPTPAELEAMLAGPKKPVSRWAQALGILMGVIIVAAALAASAAVIAGLVWIAATIVGAL